MNYTNVITRPHCTPRHDQGAVLVCAGEHEHYYSTHPAHRAAPHPNPNLRWLGARGCMLVACVDESFLACGCVLLACADELFDLEARVEWTLMHM